MSTYIIDLISHLTLRKIGLTRIKALSPPMCTCTVESRGGFTGGMLDLEPVMYSFLLIM